MKAVILGIIASFFFAFTFILNRSMNLSGGSWVWSAVLRYGFTVLPLLVIVLFRGNLRELLVHMKKNLLAWLLWSTVGFGIFYAPMCFAAGFGPGWLVASTWQITIVAGSLLVPFLAESVDTGYGRERKKGQFPVKGMFISLVILTGVALVQKQQAAALSGRELLLIIPVLIAAFAYPLGNRKMMALCGREIDTYQRVLGMTLASLPFWFILALYGVASTGLPGKTQLIKSFLVAVFSGIIATLLFFKATDLTGGNFRQMAAVEATQSGEVIFALLGELIFLKGNMPTITAFIGMALVVLGMVLHSFLMNKEIIIADKSETESVCS